MNKSKYQDEYLKRIYLLQDYIEKNWQDTFTSEDLAKISGFSKYHLHRIFKAVTGESIFEYRSRVKMEWSLGLLANRPDLSITDIAYELGFSDSAVFSRAFKNYFQITPKEFRNENSNNCKEYIHHSTYNKPIDQDGKTFGRVELIHIESFPVIYKRKIGSYDNLKPYAESLEELFKYSIENNLLDMDTCLPLTIYHTSPDTTVEENQRTSICLSIRQNIKNVDDNRFNVMEIPSGLYGIGHFEISQNEYPKAWDYLYGEWLPNSGYLPRNSFPFEVYLNNPFEDVLNRHIVDIYIPLEPIKK